VDTLAKTCGPGFAKGYRSGMHLPTLRKRCKSLHGYLKKHRR
jgi:hypothetical protein